MTSSMLLVAQTARHRYAIRRDDVTGIVLAADTQPLPVDQRGQPYLDVELGPLLDPDDHSRLARRRALLVPMRRRIVALLVDQVELLDRQVGTCPLPALLAARLREPWAIGVLGLDEALCIQIDIRAVARSALIRALRAPQPS